MIVGGFFAWSASQWTWMTSFHAKMGMSTVVIGFLMILGGVSTSIIKFKLPMEWNTPKKLLLGKFHGYFAYAVILVSQVAVVSGLNNYYNTFGDVDLGYILIALTFGGFIVSLIVGEVIYQYNLQKDIPLPKVEKTMSA